MNYIMDTPERLKHFFDANVKVKACQLYIRLQVAMVGFYSRGNHFLVKPEI